jgi:hypothetical protein
MSLDLDLVLQVLGFGIYPAIWIFCEMRRWDEVRKATQDGRSSADRRAPRSREGAAPNC